MTDDPYRMGAGMGARYDPRALPPHSETPGYAWSRDPAMLAQEIAASVMRRMIRDHGTILAAKAEQVGMDLRNALDRELTAALRPQEKPHD